MSHTLFWCTRVIVALILIFTFADGREVFSWRALAYIISFLLFFLVSFCYERKRQLFSVGYLFYFVVAFLDFNVGPYVLRFNKNVVDKANIGYIPDQYFLYWIIFISISLIILIYLLPQRTFLVSRIKWNLYIPVKQSENIIFTFLLLLVPSFLWGGEMGIIILLPAVLYMIIIVVADKRLRKQAYSKLGLFLSVLIILSTITRRFIFIEYIMPLIFFYITYKSQQYQNTFSRKIVISLVLVLICGGLYGIISELIKLNLYYGGSYTINDFLAIMQSGDLLEKWLTHQSYRIIDIWTRLGTNIIIYTDTHGFLWGLSYVKFLAPVFGFPYVSLPDISAELIGASYAQPGLVAEGYANFGIIGSIINLGFVFFLAEFLLERYIKAQNILNLILYIAPFSQILLDGGTLMSALVIIFYVYMTMFITQVITKLKNRALTIISIK